MTRNPSCSEGEYHRRYEAVWAGMRDVGLDALVVYGDSSSEGANLANCVYLTGYEDPWFSYVVVLPDRPPTLLTSNPLYLPYAREVAATDDIDTAGWSPGSRLAGLLRDSGTGTGKIGLTGVRAIHKATLPHDHFVALTYALPAATWVDSTDLLAGVRRVKSAEEAALLRAGAKVTDATVGALVRDAVVGMSEHEVGGLIRAEAGRHDGVQRLVFIGATPMDDPDLVFPRQGPSPRVLQEGDILLTELSSSYQGYPGQVHRPVTVAAQATRRYQRLFDIAVDVFHAVVGAIRPGASDDDVRDAARPVLEQADMWTMDSLVHGWGLSIEPPRIDVTERALIQRPQEPIVLETGMALVVQPHVLDSDRAAGLQVGALVLVTDDGAEILQHHPMELGQVDTGIARSVNSRG